MSHTASGSKMRYKEIQKYKNDGERSSGEKRKWRVTEERGVDINEYPV